jgi:hypothetical protein
MAVWTDKKTNATVREVDEDGMDSENGPFLALSLKEAIQAVSDGVHDRGLREEVQ